MDSLYVKLVLCQYFLLIVIHTDTNILSLNNNDIELIVQLSRNLQCYIG